MNAWEGKWEIVVLPFVDDIVLISNSIEKLDDLFYEFERVPVKKNWN